MALPPAVVGALFLIAVVGALSYMAYMVWRTSKPSDFFSEAVADSYQLELAEEEIEFYYKLKDKFQEQYAPDVYARVQSGEDPEPVSIEGMDPKQAAMATMPWTVRVPAEQRSNLQKALLFRLVACIDKLDQVQKDKPGNWKLWQSKLISEHYWTSLCEAEKLVSSEIESCMMEAEELQPGWKEQIFMQAVQHWRYRKQEEEEKKQAKKEVEKEKKAAKSEVKKSEAELRKEIEEKVKQERAAQKAMEKLLAEEEAANKKGGKKEAPKSKSKKK